MARILTLTGQIAYRPARAMPKPKAKELAQGYEVKAYIPRGEGFDQEHMETCKVIEVNGNVVTVSWERWAWDKDMEAKDKQAIRKVCYSTITMSKVICIAAEYDWHEKILSGGPGGPARVTGLVQPSALDSMATV